MSQLWRRIQRRVASSGAAHWPWIKALISLLVLGWVVHTTDLAALGSAVRRLELHTVAWALILVIVQQIILAWRWHRIVEWLGAPWRLAQSLRWVFVALLFNQVLPSAAGGDAIRIWAMRRHGIPLPTAIGSVALERGSGLALLALIIAAASLSSLRKIGGELAWTLLFGAFCVVTALVLTLFADKWLLRWLPAQLAESSVRIAAMARSLLRTPSAIGELAATGCVATFLGLWAAVALGRNLGIELDAGAYFALVGGAILLSLVPVSLGGWGIREAGMVALFGYVGTPSERAVALSVAWGILPVLAALPGGGYFWLRRRYGVVDESPVKPQIE